MPAGLSNPIGLTRYDFSTLPTGLLPVGTYFAFGDVDGGSSTNENFILQAFDAAGALITNAWLDQPIGVNGIGTGPGSTILPGNLPGWTWDAGTSTYTISGAGVTGGNPSLTVWIQNNTAIGSLAVERTSGFANFSLSAPIPSPGGMGVLALAAGIAARRRR